MTVLCSILFAILFGISAYAATPVKIGKVEARGLYSEGRAGAPAIVMLPGSGAQGPEERMPASLTTDGKEHSIFDEVAQPFVAADCHTLQLGKPGVDFFTAWNALFYDVKLYQSLRWSDLIDNARAGLDFLSKQKGVDPQRLYFLGHSEGTQLAVDAARGLPVKGLILLGYSGEDALTTVAWQLFQRDVDHFVKTDVDIDGDGFVTREEAAPWAGYFNYPWQPGQSRVSLPEIETWLRTIPARIAFYHSLRDSAFCADGHCARGPIYTDTVAFPGDLHVLTGELDLQTRAAEAVRLKAECARVGKKNCAVEIVPGVQHGFNPPRGPRRHPLLDIAIGPVETSFQERLRVLANQL